VNKRHFEVGDIVKYVGHKNTGSGAAGYITKISLRYTYIKWFAKGVEHVEVPVPTRKFLEKISE